MVSSVVSRSHIASAGRSTASRFVGLVERVCFWTAVVLPILYIPGFLLVAAGYISSMTFVGVVGLNVAAAALGYRYEPGKDRSTDRTEARRTGDRLYDS